jgi:putative membrane protein
MRLLLRLLITAIALAVTVWLLPGIHITGNNSVLVVVVTAIIFGIVNAVVRPILTLLSCGLIVVTLGLFLLVINALMLALASWIAVNWFGIGFYIDNFWWALLGSIVISIVSFVLSMLLPDERRTVAAEGRY